MTAAVILTTHDPAKPDQAGLPLLSTGRVAKLLGFDRSAIIRWIKAGVLIIPREAVMSMREFLATHGIEALLPPALQPPIVRQVCTELTAIETVQQLVDAYLTHGTERLGARTIEDKTRILKAFALCFGPMRVSDCKRYMLTDWIAQHPSLKSNWTKYGWASSVRAAFNWACKEDRIDRNPFDKLAWSIGGRRRQPMSDQQYRALLRVANPPFRSVVFFQAMTGARPGEMAAALWENVDWERSAIVLHEHKTAHTQREPRPRTIILHPVVLRMLQVLCRRRRPSQEHVFVNAWGLCWKHSAICQRMKGYRAKAGIPPGLSLYSLRHAFATRCIVNGVDLKTTSELMGHSAVRMTEWYTHIAGNTEHLQRAVDQANRPKFPPKLPGDPPGQP